MHFFVCSVVFLFVVLFVWWSRSWLDTLTLTVQYVTKGQTLKNGYKQFFSLSSFADESRVGLLNCSIDLAETVELFRLFTSGSKSGRLLDLDLDVVHCLIQQSGLVQRSRNCALAAYWCCVAAARALKHWTEAATTHSAFGINLFALCSWMRTTTNSSHFLCIHHQMYLRVLFLYWHRQNNKRQRLQLRNTNSVYGKRRRKNFRSLCVLSIRRPSDSQPLEKPVNNTCYFRSLCVLSIRRPSDSQPLEKPVNNTCNRTAKTSEIADL